MKILYKRRFGLMHLPLDTAKDTSHMWILIRLAAAENLGSYYIVQI